MSEDLHNHLRTVIEERLAVARAASPWPWHLNAEGDEVWAVDDELVADAYALSNNQQRATAAHIALHDPADAVRRYEVDLRRLERHKPYWFTAGPTVCDGDHSGQNSLWPCDEIKDLAASLGIEVSGG